MYTRLVGDFDIDEAGVVLLTKKQAEAFKNGFEDGNEYRPIPNLRIESVEDNLHWENHFGFFKLISL